MVSGSRQRNSTSRAARGTRSRTQIIVGTRSTTMPTTVSTARVSDVVIASRHRRVLDQRPPRRARPLTGARHLGAEVEQRQQRQQEEGREGEEQQPAQHPPHAGPVPGRARSRQPPRRPLEQPGVETHDDRDDDDHLEGQGVAEVGLAQDHLAGSEARISSGVIGAPWLTRAAAVAYAANALANSSSAEPRKAGRSSGNATCVQYWVVVAPRLTAASRHCGRSPSRAGRKTITISGIWK